MLASHRPDSRPERVDAMNEQALLPQAPNDGEGTGVPLVEVRHLTKRFAVSKNLFRRPSSFIHAVDDVSFQLHRGESLGVVGESGCGKTTIGKLLVKLIEPDDGSIQFRFADDEADSASSSTVDPSLLRGKPLKDFRRRAQMIFQDPYESMNPRRTIYDIVSEPLSVQGLGSVMDRVNKVLEILTSVGLAPASEFLFRHPHELSGGQRQRVAIARALVIGPEFVVADEPTSMLDVSSRAGIMLLMQQLAQDLEISYLHITHDLAVARYMCDRISVMYLGKIVEVGETEELLRNPLHPYTKALLSAVPVPQPGHRRQPPDIRGDLALPLDPPARCRFYDRCPVATDRCRVEPHPASEEKAPGHLVACYEA